MPSRAAVSILAAALAGCLAIGAGVAIAGAPGPARGCGHFGRAALALDPRPGAVRVFAVQFRQTPAAIVDAAAYRRAIACVMAREVLPHLARGRANVVVFDEDIGLEALAAGPRGAAARGLLARGVPACAGQGFPCATLAVLAALDRAYAPALAYLAPRYPALGTSLGRALVAATDTFARVFMTTMADVARRYGVYVVASNTQAPLALSHASAAVRAFGDPGARTAYVPTAGVAYDQTFVWAPHVLHHGRPAPLANLLAVNRKVPLTAFELALGVASGPARGAAAVANLRPVAIPGTVARLGFATSLPAFVYGTPSPGHACDDVARTYMRCLDSLGANVLIQADANDGAWTGPDGSDTAEHWQPLSWMGSAWRAVSDPSIHFAYAVNPMLVGNLADTPFDGQSAVLERGRRGPGCHYVGDGRFVPGEDDPALRAYAGPKPQFLALAPWVTPDGPRAALRSAGTMVSSRGGYVRTALVADLTFPVDRSRPGCVMAGR